MIAEQSYGAHSAQVERQLIVNGESISITHMGPDFLLIEPARDHPQQRATVTGDRFLGAGRYHGDKLCLASYHHLIHDIRQHASI